MSLPNNSNKINVLCEKIRILNRRISNGSGGNQTLFQTLGFGNDANGLSIEDLTGNLQLQTTSNNAVESGGQFLAPDFQGTPLNPQISYAFSSDPASGLTRFGTGIVLISQDTDDDQALELQTPNGGITIGAGDTTGPGNININALNGGILDLQGNGGINATMSNGVFTITNLIAVAVPTNANAAGLGVPLNGLYRDTADPAQIYIRTV